LEGVDVSFSSFLCAREKDRLDFGKKVEALLEEGWVIEINGILQKNGIILANVELNAYFCSSKYHY